MLYLQTNHLLSITFYSQTLIILYNLDVRKEEILAIKKRFPTKIPVSVPPQCTCRQLVNKQLRNLDRRGTLLERIQLATIGHDQILGAAGTHHVAVPRSSQVGQNYFLHVIF